VKRPAAFCNAATSDTARKALSLFGNVTCSRFSSPLDEVVPVQIVCGLKRKEGGDAHRHRTRHFVFNAEVVVGETAALPGQNTVVWVFRGKRSSAVRRTTV
jgi:hypothetical protein